MLPPDHPFYPLASREAYQTRLVAESMMKGAERSLAIIERLSPVLATPLEQLVQAIYPDHQVTIVTELNLVRWEIVPKNDKSLGEFSRAVVTVEVNLLFKHSGTVARFENRKAHHKASYKIDHTTKAQNIVEVLNQIHQDLRIS